MMILIPILGVCVAIGFMLRRVAELERQEVELEEREKAEAALQPVGHIVR